MYHCSALLAVPGPGMRSVISADIHLYALNNSYDVSAVTAMMYQL
jgi:hypothetical protein